MLGWRLHLVTLLVLAVWVPSAHASKRVALVVGNGAYAEAPSLANPTNDATDMAGVLQEMGFSVTLVVDADQRAMQQGLIAFAQEAAGADVALFFYAGHGVQTEGENYLLPTDVRLTSSTALRFETINLDQILHVMAKAKVRLVLLDACRDNPLAAANRSLGAGRGLAPVDTASASGTLIAFATAPDDVAADGIGRNSPFTEALLAHLPTPGEDIRAIFGLVREQVERATDRRQTPWVNEAISGRLVLVSKAAETATAPASGGVQEQELELEYWRHAKALGSLAAYRTYLAEFPKGRFASLARLEIERLEREAAASVQSASSGDGAGTAQGSAAGEQSASIESSESTQAPPATALEPSDAYPEACRRGRDALDRLANLVAEEWLSICLQSGALNERDRLVALFDRGKARLEADEYDQALADFDEVVRALPDSAEAYRHCGLVYREKGLFDRAIAEYDRAIDLDPINARAYYNRGFALDDKGEFDSAIADYDKAIALDPTFAPAFNARGAAYQKIKELSRAFDDYDRAVSLDPGMVKAYYNRGRIHSFMGRKYEARLDYDRAIDLDPSYELAYWGRGELFIEEQRYDDAIAEFTEGIRINPESRLSLTGRGRAYRFKGLYENAIADFDQVIRLYPTSVYAFNLRGRSYYLNEHYDDAISDFDQALRLDPVNAYAYRSRGRAYANKGMHTKAIRDFDRAIELEPDDATAYYNRGASACHVARPKQAISDYTRAASLQSSKAKELQEFLKSYGYYRGAIDGVFGPASKAALRAWVTARCS